MKKQMRVLVAMDGNDLEERMIDNKLETFQKIVEGNIECPYIYDKIDVILNEEGKIIELPERFAIVRGDRVLDNICGNVIFCGHDNKGNFKSLTDKQIEFVMSKTRDINSNGVRALYV